MIGTFNFDSISKKVTVVGGGVSGLMCALILDQCGYEVTLYEKKSLTGGMLSTEETAFGIAEKAAHSFLITPRFRLFCEELGVELLPVKKNSHARFILKNGRMRKFPLTMRDTLNLLRHVFFKRASGSEVHWNLQEWSEHFLGKAATRFLMTPFVRGIYGARLEDLLSGIAFPKLKVPRGETLGFYLLRNKFGSKKKKRPTMGASKNGMQGFTTALTQTLRDRISERLITDVPFTNLNHSTENLILAISPWDASRLLADIEPRLSDALKKVKFSSLVSVTVFFKKSAVLRNPIGVGLLVPENEEASFLGILFNSSAFEGRIRDQDDVSCTVMLGERFLTESDAMIRKTLELELGHYFGLKEPLLELVISRWEHAIPLYDGNLSKVWELASETWCLEPGRMLFSNYAGELSIRQMAEQLFDLRDEIQRRNSSG